MRREANAERRAEELRELRWEEGKGKGKGRTRYEEEMREIAMEIREMEMKGKGKGKGYGKGYWDEDGFWDGRHWVPSSQEKQNFCFVM